MYVGLPVYAGDVVAIWSCAWVGLLLPYFFLGGRLVLLCHKTFTSVAPCILDVCCLMCLAVALLDSSFLAICCTLAAGIIVQGRCCLH